MSSTILPRRSPRLASKYATPATPELPTSIRNPLRYPSTFQEERETRRQLIDAIVTASSEEEKVKQVELLKKYISMTANINPPSHGKLTLTKEESHAKFLAYTKNPTGISDEFKSECVDRIKHYLDDCEALNGKTSKMVLASRLLRYFIQIPIFLAAFDRFYKAVLAKLEEFKLEGPCIDPLVDAQFRSAIEDLYYVIGHKA